jgi:hypothetical protein
MVDLQRIVDGQTKRRKYQEGISALRVEVNFWIEIEERLVGRPRL